jgi:hypothetical protein
VLGTVAASAMSSAVLHAECSSSWTVRMTGRNEYQVRASSASIAPVGGQHPHIAAGPVSRRVAARGALSPCREARAIARFAAVRADVSQRQPLPCQPSDWIFTTETG